MTVPLSATYSGASGNERGSAGFTGLMLKSLSPMFHQTVVTGIGPLTTSARTVSYPAGRPASSESGPVTAVASNSEPVATHGNGPGP